jgi:predicted acetyltransferase
MAQAFELTFAKTMDDLKEIADLMSKVYVRGSYFDLYRTRMDYQTKDPYYKPEHSRIIRVAGRVVSHVSIIEKYMKIGRAVVKVAGIGDVYTHPEHRKKNFSRILMEDAINYMKQNQYPLTMLYGIPNFYHKFGYIEAIVEYATFVRTATALDVKPTLPVRPYEPPDAPRLNDLYNATYANKTCAMVREPAHWYKMGDPKTAFVVTDRAGEISGYALFKQPYGAPFYVTEVAAPMPEIEQTILATFVQKARDAVIPEIEFRLAPDHPLWGYLQDFGARNISHVYKEGEGQGMLGITDLLPLFENLRPELEERIAHSRFFTETGGFNIVTDIGEISLHFAEGKVNVREGKQERVPTLNAPQNWLVRSVIGYWDVARLDCRLRTQGKNAGIPEALKPILEVLLPLDFPYTCEADYF